MRGGYAGKILRVSLGDRRFREEPISEELVRQYIGGSGLAARILVQETDLQVAPLSPNNLLIFMAGPLAGTMAPSSGRHAVVAKAPLTGLFGEGDVGGRFSVELKKAGFDGVVFEGKADAPVYMWITNDMVELRDASHIWGKDTYYTAEALRKETHPDASVACIGPAGENCVYLANIMHEGRHARAGGRGGLGAVMGSKKLKAVVCKGTGSILVANAEMLRDSVRAVSRQLSERNKSLSLFGTAGYVDTAERIGDLPVRNWSKRFWRKGAEATDGVALKRIAYSGHYRCGSCFVGCGKEVKLLSNRFGNIEGAGPEYETVACFGANCDVDDVEAILLANDLCNRYGLDTISTGSVIAFAMDTYQCGFLSEDDCGHVVPVWGDADAMISLVEDIAHARGLGALLGQGVMRAASALGADAVELAVHCKGLEFPAHDPRAFRSNMLSYATSNRGACHLQSFSHTYESGHSDPMFGIEPNRTFMDNPARFVSRLQDLMCLFDSLKVCKFMIFGGLQSESLLQWLNAVTGFEMTTAEFVKAGERIFNLKRAYNVRCGVTRENDKLPPRILRPRSDARGEEEFQGVEEMLDEYYAERGWDVQGRPTSKKLKELDLEWVML